MPKNSSVCAQCPFKDKVKLEKDLFEEREDHIKKIRLTKDGPEKDSAFLIEIRNCLNRIEMFSCLNCIGATGENGNPEPEKLSVYYCCHVNGASLLGEKKIAEIKDEVTSSFNESEAKKEINRQPDVWDDFKHYVLNNGLEDYYKKHREYVPA
jgi:hypothetical protein